MHGRSRRPAERTVACSTSAIPLGARDFFSGSVSAKRVYMTETLPISRHRPHRCRHGCPLAVPGRLSFACWSR